MTVGRGGLVIYEESSGTAGGGRAGFREVRRYAWRDGLFDVTWSEVNEAILVAAAGDGSVLIFDQNVADAPAVVLPGHTAEVSPYRESNASGIFYKRVHSISNMLLIFIVYDCNIVAHHKCRILEAYNRPYSYIIMVISLIYTSPVTWIDLLF